MNLKNVRSHPLDVGGRMLPSGESADLDEKSLPVAEAIASEHLVPVQTPPEPSSARSAKPKES